MSASIFFRPPVPKLVGREPPEEPEMGHSPLKGSGPGMGPWQCRSNRSKAGTQGHVNVPGGVVKPPGGLQPPLRATPVALSSDCSSELTSGLRLELWSQTGSELQWVTGWVNDDWVSSNEWMSHRGGCKPPGGFTTPQIGYMPLDPCCTAIVVVLLGPPLLHSRPTTT